MAFQIAALEQQAEIESIIKRAEFRSAEAAEICRIGLQNYFAGALVLPYQTFMSTAKDLRHDLELLAARFGASLEQVAHRLSTLQRPGLKGIPVFFATIDRAGNITKRHSGAKLQFARFGAACPLWNAHQAFEVPGRIIRQLAETPDGIRYLSIATEVIKSGGGYRAPHRRYAIALGCEISYAKDFRLCRRARPDQPRSLRADRHLLPDLRTRHLFPTGSASAEGQTEGRPSPPCGLAVCCLLTRDLRGCLELTFCEPIESMRRVAAISIIVSDVCTRYS